MKSILSVAGKPARLLRYVLLSIVSGAFSFAFMAFVNSLINEMIKGKANTYNPAHIAAFAGIVFLFVLSRRILAVAVINLSQRIFWHIRKDIINLMLQSEYAMFVRNKAGLHASLVRDVNILTLASINIIQFSSSVVIIVSCFVYMAVISPLLFAISLVVLATGVYVYYRSMQTNERFLQRARDLEDHFIRSFNALLNGFKEIHLSPGKGKDIFESEIEQLETASIANNRKAYVGFLNNQIVGQVLFNCLIGVLLLGLTFLLKLEVQVVVNFLFILLFLLGATENAMVILPGLIQAKVSVARIAEMQQVLGSNELQEYSSDLLWHKDAFQELMIDQIIYTYQKSDAAEDVAQFTIGPVHLEVRRGDVIFIYGGNGSGKTTFIYALLGLLKPQQGVIYFNGNRLTDENYKHYRMMFGVVFSDFYLFDKLYGLDKVDVARVTRYLSLFELDNKVTFNNNAFSSRDLSTGQRKRLALISVLLEDKPVLVLDEWAADQDPHFRRKFYLEIIPVLQQEGYTIIAITHDDKYYHCADKLYEMDYGILKHISQEVLQGKILSV